MNRNTHHIFNKNIAKEFGINAAIILENMMFWLEKNQANEVNYYEGKYWTFNSISAYAKIFNYLSERQIKYALDSLEEQGIIETGNFNKKGFDRTKWYTITDYGYSILQNVSIVSTKCQMDTYKMYEPIPYINTDINEVNKDIVESSDSTIPYKEIIDYLNDKTNKNYRNVKTNKRLIKARFNEGYTLEDFKQVIDNMNAAWGSDNKMKNYLRPATLFGTKFDSYLNYESGSREDIELDIKMW